MSVDGYIDRETIVRTATAGHAVMLAPQYLGNIIRYAGDEAMMKAEALTGSVSPDSRHGPRTALYAVTNYYPGGPDSLAYTLTQPDDEHSAEDLEAIRQTVLESARRTELFDADTAALLHHLAVLAVDRNFQGPVVNTGIELRVAPDDATYVALLIPNLLDDVTAKARRYMANVRMQKLPVEVPPGIREVAGGRDPAQMQRRLALTAVKYLVDAQVTIESFEDAIGQRSDG